jgi:hypothetical protein
LISSVTKKFSDACGSSQHRAKARAAGCQPQSEGWAIGLEFLEPSGWWRVVTPVSSGKPLQG